MADLTDYQWQIFHHCKQGEAIDHTLGSGPGLFYVQRSHIHFLTSLPPYAHAFIVRSCLYCIHLWPSQSPPGRHDIERTSQQKNIVIVMFLAKVLASMFTISSTMSFLLSALLMENTDISSQQ